MIWSVFVVVYLLLSPPSFSSHLPSVESDFEDVDETVVFAPGTTSSCLNVTIFDDTAFQKTRYFMLQIGDVEENVHVYVGTLEIHIHDDDGKEIDHAWLGS